MLQGTLVYAEYIEHFCLMKNAYGNKVISLLDNFFGHLADYERFMCVILHL